ncbi:MAG: alpha/beta hydrolase, partial [Calditrichaeota bacterium]|nr:alpha/beta hydrolase [Calditrichota bacterium]
YLERLGEIHCPVLIVHGADDRLLPARHSREAHHLLPHSRLELIPGCGHLPSREHPEILNALLIEFLENTVPEV